MSSVFDEHFAQIDSGNDLTPPAKQLQSSVFDDHFSGRPDGEGVTGAIGDVARGTASGLVKGAESVAGAAEWFLPEDTQAESVAKNVKESIGEFHKEHEKDWFAESRTSQQAREDWYNPRGWFYGGFESLGQIAPGLAATVATGGTAGLALGGATTATQFWGSTAQDVYEEDIKSGKLNESDAVSHANWRGFIEGGLEAVQQIIPFGIAKFLPKNVAGNLIKTAAGSIGQGKVQVAKNILKTIASETAMEMGQEAGGIEADVAYGMRDQHVRMADVLPVIGPSIVMSLVLGGGAAVSEDRAKKQIHDALTQENVDPKLREAAAKYVFDAVAKQDEELAQMWRDQVMPSLQANQPVAVPLDDEIREAAKMQQDRQGTKAQTVQQAEEDKGIQPEIIPTAQQLPPISAEKFNAEAQAYRQEVDQKSGVVRPYVGETIEPLQREAITPNQGEAQPLINELQDSYPVDNVKAPEGKAAIRTSPSSVAFVSQQEKDNIFSGSAPFENAQFKFHQDSVGKSPQQVIEDLKQLSTQRNNLDMQVRDKQGNVRKNASKKALAELEEVESRIAELQSDPAVSQAIEQEVTTLDQRIANLKQMKKPTPAAAENLRKYRKQRKALLKQREEIQGKKSALISQQDNIGRGDLPISPNGEIQQGQSIDLNDQAGGFVVNQQDTKPVVAQKTENVSDKPTLAPIEQGAIDAGQGQRSKPVKQDQPVDVNVQAVEAKGDTTPERGPKYFNLLSRKTKKSPYGVAMTKQQIATLQKLGGTVSKLDDPKYRDMALVQTGERTVLVKRNGEILPLGNKNQEEIAALRKSGNEYVLNGEKSSAKDRVAGEPVEKAGKQTAAVVEEGGEKVGKQDAPEKTSATDEKPVKEAPPTRKDGSLNERIEDFGEKIGGGRENVSSKPGETKKTDKGIALYSLNGLTTGKPVTAETVKSAFPGAEIVHRTKDEWRLKMPSGAVITVKTNEVISIDPESMRKAYGKAPGKKIAVGEFTQPVYINMVGVIRLAKIADAGTLDHEAFHAAMAMALNQNQIQTVILRYGSEEKAAEAYRKWKGQQGDGIFQRLKAFFTRLLGKVFPTAESVFADIKSGKVWQQQGGQRVSDPKYMVAAWHGSPHDFDRFSTEKIGTGEGAQAYGYGLYFSSKKEVAEYYRKELAGETANSVEVEEYTIADKRNWIATTYNEDGERIEHTDFIDDDELRELIGNSADEIIEKAENDPGSADGTYEIEKSPGRLYQVELAPEADEYLLWDRPLSEQSEKVKAALENVGDSISWTYEDFYENEASGRSIYDRISYDLGRDQKSGKPSSDRAASEYLHSLGIRGIKYLDGTSRDKGEGAYNYVVFSDGDVNIVSKFSRKGSKGGTLSKQEVDDFLAPILKKWGNAPDVKVVESYKDTPKDIRQEIEAALKMVEGAPSAIYSPAHGVFIFADKAQDTQHALYDLLHETIGHYGLRGAIGTEKLTKILREVATVKRKQIREIADIYGLDLSKEQDVLLAAEELLADMAGQNEINGFITRAIAAIRDWLRGLGVNLKYLDTDILRLIEQSHRFVKDGTKGATNVNRRHVTITEDANLDNFQPWMLYGHSQASRFSLLGKDGRKTATRMANRISNTYRDNTTARFRYNVGKFIATPWFDTEGKPKLRQVVNRNVDRSDSRNAFISDVAETSGDYLGIAGMREVWRKMSKADRGQVDKLLIEGDIARTVYTDEQLDSNLNPLGKPVGEHIKKAYKAFRQSIDKAFGMFMERLNLLTLIPYEGTPVFDALEGYAKRGLTPEQVDKELGIIRPAVDAYRAIEIDRGRIAKHLESYKNRPFFDTLVDLYIRGLTPLEVENEFGTQRALMKAYHDTAKDMNNMNFSAISGYRGKSWFKTLDELLKKGENHPMFKGLELSDAYHDVMEYRTEIDKMRKEWGRLKGYIPHNRESGEWHVYAYVVDKQSDEITPIFMQPTDTWAQAEKLFAQVKKNPDQHFPKNFDKNAEYRFEIKENMTTPEEMFVGRGADTNLIQFINSAIDKADRAGTIENAKEIRDRLTRELGKQIVSRGFGRHVIKRADHLIEGYDTENTLKMLQEHIGAMAGYLTKAEYSIRVSKDAEQVEKPMDQVWAKEYISDSLKNSTKFDQMQGTLRALMTTMFLGGRISTAILNSTQNYVVGQAELARLGVKAPMKAIMKAQKDVVANTMTDEEHEVLRQGERTGRTQAQYVREMLGSSEAERVRDMPSLVMRKVAEVSMIPFQAVESKWNREPALLAAYRSLKQTKEGDFDQKAYDKAVEFVNNVHFVMGKENLPEIVRKIPFGRTLYTFQSYAHNYLHWLANRIKDGELAAVGRSMTALVALGGISALPFGDDLDRWWTQFFGVSPKRGFERFLRDHASEYGDTGEAIVDYIMHGAPAGLGINFSRSLAIQVPILGGDRDSLAERASGAAGGLVKKGAYAAKSIERGDYGRAVENISPEAIANLFRAYRYSQGATTASGKPIFDDTGRQVKYDPLESMAKALGFSPLRAAKAQEKRSSAYDLKGYWEDERQTLIDRYRLGRDRKEVLEDIRDFNNRLSGSQARHLVPAITGKTLSRSVETRRDKRMQAYLSEA